MMVLTKEEEGKLRALGAVCDAAVSGHQVLTSDNHTSMHVGHVDSRTRTCACTRIHTGMVTCRRTHTYKL